MNKIVLLFFVLLCLHASAQVKPAFQEGEWLKFKIKYGWFNTSEATMSIKNSSLQGDPMYHITGFGKTTGMLDVFFKVRNNFESYISKEDGLSHKFIRKTSEGGHTKDKMIDFVPKENKAIVHNYKHGKVSEHQTMPFTQDLLSALYYLRNKVDISRIKVGDEFFLNLFFDEENFNFKVKYIGEEVIKTKFGNVNTLIFKPYVQADRIFKEEEGVTIWITKDHNKIPVKIEAQILVGSITATLDQYKGLQNPFLIQF